MEDIRPTDPVEIDDGYLIDPETGEVVGHTESEFRVRDEDTANWVLQKMLAEQAAIDAVRANLERLERRHESRLNWLKLRFSHELEEFARAARGERKSVVLPYGALKFRTTQPSIALIDGATEWVERNAPNALKIEKSVLKSKLTEEQRAAAVDAGVAEIVPAHESFAIKLGGGS